MERDGRVSVEEQAAAWLIRADSSEMTPVERDTFQAWIDADSRHRVAYLRLQVAWKKAGRLLKLSDLPAVQTPRPRRSLAIAASVVIATVAIAWYSSRQQTYTTAVGNSERISLPDGSTLVLNTNSKAQVNFGERRREIELLRGEAHFRVARDPGRPFTVRAAGTTVRALGTAFSVRVRDAGGQVEVLVTEGRVALSSSELGVGDAAVVRSGSPRINRVAAADMSRKLAWQEGLLKFNGETLAEAVAEFNRYNRRQLTLADASLAALRVGGGFQTTDLESFLAALEHSFGIRALRPADEGPIALAAAESN